MSKQKKKAKQKVPGKCIFCGLGNLSKEHFWPQWTASVLRATSSSGPYRQELVVRENKTHVVSHHRKERPGHVTTLKVRAVCANCNSEWMSAIETAAQPILTPMMLGKRLSLSPEMQIALVQWITLKLMVGEQTNQPDAIFRQSELAAFRMSRTIPSHLRVWITQCFSDTWCNAYMRHAVTFAPPNFVKRPPVDKKNSYATVFGIGQLFIFSMGTTYDGLDLLDHFKIGDELKPLWPLAGVLIQWPPDSAINDTGASRIGMAFDALMKDPRTLWHP